MEEKVLLVSVEPPETRIAEIRNGELFDFSIERSGHLLGDIFRGKIRDIVPGMNTAFVDIGLTKAALLYAGDIASSQNKPIHKLVKSGDDITVQIARPPLGNKGARVTNKISLSGRFVVVRCAQNNTGISKKITDKKERQRLRLIAEKLRLADKGIIVRSQAFGAHESDIIHDATWAVQQLDSALKRAQNAEAPAVISRAHGVLEQFIRDRLDDSVAHIFIDNQEEYEKCRAFAAQVTPESAHKISLYAHAIPLFQRYNLQKDLQNITERSVPLPHGGTLIIDEAEALCAIDVNTASFTGKKQFADTALTTNLEAAKEACRQLRLRDIGGIIVIDFIDMSRSGDREKVLLELKKSVKEDYTRANIVQVSPSGLVELSRQRKSVSIRRLQRKNCECCDGDGTVFTPVTIAIEARRQLRTLARRDGAKTATITLHPNAARAMIGDAGHWIINLEKSAAIKVALRANAVYKSDAIDIVRDQLTPIPASIKMGTRIHISPHTAIHSKHASHYLIHQGMIIKLEDFSPNPAIIEITHCSQHFCTARVLVAHKNGGFEAG